MTYYSGCNYWKNYGANEFEPVGTATSMHECDDCHRVEYCLAKKEYDVWDFNETKQVRLWNLTVDIEKTKGCEE